MLSLLCQFCKILHSVKKNQILGIHSGKMFFGVYEMFKKKRKMFFSGLWDVFEKNLVKWKFASFLITRF